jgi:Fe-S cluster assembly protein SufD
VNRAEESLARAIEATPAAAEPAFAAALRRAGAGDFLRLHLPTTRHEEWLYTSLAGLGALELSAAPAVRPDAAALARLGGLPPAPRLVLVNGRLDPALSDLSGLPAGSFGGSLAAALRERPGQVEPFLGRAPFHDHAFAALNAALFADGAVLILPDGASAAAPVQVVHWTLAGAAPVAAFPRCLVIAGKRAQATVVEGCAGEGTYLAAGMTELFLGEESRVELVRLQREAPEAFHVGLLGVTQGAGTRFAARSVALGARVARFEARALLAGEETENLVDGLYLAGGAQVHDHFIHVDHACPRGTSRELFKGILDGQARGIFTGRVLVRPGAQKTDAGQVSSNLLLSEDATVDTRPQLEILADDVKCSHGGTVGQLDEEALFYLRSRGIDRPTARALLTWAFAAEMVERLPGSVRQGVRRLVTARLPDGERLREAA